MNSLVPLNDADGIPLAAIGRLMWARRYLIASVTMVCIVIALVLALTATKYYSAEAVITEARAETFSSDGGLVSQFGAVASIAGINVGGDAGSLAREAKAVLESRSLVEEFITREAILAQLSTDPSRPLTLWQGVRQFRENILLIKEDTRKGKITVAIKWTDPVVAANWANRLVELCNEIVRARAIDDAARNIHYLNEQIARTNIVEMQHIMYNLVANETKTLMLANARRDYAFRVVDFAVPPEERVSPKRTLIVLSGLLIGLLSGMFFALIRTMLPHGRRDAESRS